MLNDQNLRCGDILISDFGNDDQPGYVHAGLRILEIMEQGIRVTRININHPETFFLAWNALEQSHWRLPQTPIQLPLF